MIGNAPPTHQPLVDLVEALGRMSARAVVDAGIQLDVDDPRVARWLMLTALDCLLTTSAISAPSGLVAMVEDASRDDATASRRQRGRHAPPNALGWDDLQALAEADGSGDRGR